MGDIRDEHRALSARIADLAVEQELTIAVTESLTSGQIAAAVGVGHDSSDWFLGGVVAYSRKVKHDLLGVARGPVVSMDAAESMAAGIQRLTDADVVVAVTGAGGPDGQDGQPPGTVFIATRFPHGSNVDEFHFEGEPSAVVEQTVTAALTALVASIEGYLSCSGGSD